MKLFTYSYRRRAGCSGIRIVWSWSPVTTSEWQKTTAAGENRKAERCNFTEKEPSSHEPRLVKYGYVGICVFGNGVYADSVLLDVTPCRLVNQHWRFGGSTNLPNDFNSIPKIWELNIPLKSLFTSLKWYITPQKT